MKRLCCDRQKTYGILFAVMIWLLAFQSPLEAVWGPLSYLDEVTALIGALLCAYEIVVKNRCRITKEMLWIGVPLCVFVMAGLAGNLIYRYQPLKSVIIDLYTNLKFFFAIAGGYYLFQGADWECLKKKANLHVSVILAILFCVFLADRIFVFFPSEIRYGLKSAKLFYSHPTYLAGAAAFLMTLLTVFFEKKNYPSIVMAAVLMLFTLRSKSIASAAVYVMLFAFFIIFKYTLKWWHVAVAGVVCVIIAWPQISFYFIELAGDSARSVMMMTSFVIMKDYFPIGTGFGTYASSEAAKNYSPVYEKYLFHKNFELRNINDIEMTKKLIAEQEWLMQEYLVNPDVLYWEPFLCDTFWPIIFGQTGMIGTIAFLLLMYQIVRRVFAVNRFNLYAYVGVLFALSYLVISSMAEPAFHNSVAIPLALCMGLVFAGMNAKTDKEFVCLKEN